MLKKIISHKWWYNDQDKNLVINDAIVKNYFNKTRSLVFDNKNALKEEQVLEKYFNKNKNLKILDLGCGNGRLAQRFNKSIDYYLGIDFSQSMIEDAKKLCLKNCEFICEKAESFIIDQKFDIIFVVGLMTYLNDDLIEVMFSNIKFMLNKNGIVIVRNVKAGANGSTRNVYKRNPGWILRLIGVIPYEIIRRSSSETKSFFKEFNIVSEATINQMGYSIYILKHKN